MQVIGNNTEKTLKNWLCINKKSQSCLKKGDVLKGQQTAPKWTFHGQLSRNFKNKIIKEKKNCN